MVATSSGGSLCEAKSSAAPIPVIRSSSRCCCPCVPVGSAAFDSPERTTPRGQILNKVV